MIKKNNMKIFSWVLVLSMIISNFIGVNGFEFAKADSITVLSEGFDNVAVTKDTITVPTTASAANWTYTNGIGGYTTAGNFKTASPSLKLQSTGNQITSPSFSLTASATLTFWIKAQGSGAPSVCTSKLLVEKSNGANWSTIEDIQLTGSTLEIKTYNLESNVKQIRYTFTKNVGNVAIDDIKIVQDGGSAPTGNIAATGVSLDKSTLSFVFGQTTTQAIAATVTPANATNKNVTWASDNMAVATVSNGIVTAGNTAGTANITATTVDGNIKSSPCVVTVSANAPPQNKTLDIIEITDFHGQLLDSTNTKPVGAALAKVVKDIKSSNPDTLVIGGGDLYQGTPTSNVLHGVPVQKVMSNIGMEVTALGNHEFDWGLDVINNETMTGANYEIVCANMYKKGTNTRAYKPYKIITKDGTRIAVIGAILQEAPTIIMPAYTANYDFKDVATEINSCAKEIRDGKLADIVLAVAHDGGTSLNTIVSNLHGVDAVFGGHTHTSFDGVNKDADGKDVPTLNAMSSGKGYIDLKISIDANNKITGFSSKGQNWHSLATTTTSPVDDDCKKIVDDASTALLPIFNEKIGHDDVSYTSSQTDNPYGESQLGNWMADVIRNYAKADVGMQNNGGIRLSPIPVGDITVGTIFNLMPFDNTVCTANMTGAQLKVLLEQAVQDNGKGIQISGVKFVYDSSKSSYKPAVKAADGTITTPEVPGQRILSIVRESDNSVVKDTDILKVAAPDFLATGGDTFTEFLEPSIASTFVDSHYTVRDALTADVRKNGKITVVMNNRVDNQVAETPATSMTIAAARAKKTGTAILTGTVSAVNGNNIFMQDETAGICVYNSGGKTFTAHKGDKITVTGPLSVYNGLLEITPASADKVVTVSTGNIIIPKEVTINAITDDLQGQLVKVKNATFTSIDNSGASMAQDSTGSINVYKMPVVTGLSVNDTADITAAVTKYNTTIELAVDSAADVVKTSGATTSTISVVATSDVHGNVLNFDYGTNSAPSKGQGLAKVSTYVKGLKASNPNVMLIDNGDTIQGTPLVNYYNMIDKTTLYPMAAVMGAMGYDTETLGNHEFNFGLDTLNRVMSDYKKGNIHVLSANTYKTDDSNFVEPYYIKSFSVNAKTVKVGILGLTTKTISSWEDTAHYAGLHFNDLVTEAQKWVPKVKEAGADVVIVAAHSGEEGTADVIPENQIKAIATNVAGIDAIVAGHAHSTLNDVTLKNPDGKVVPVVEPGKWAQNVSEIDIAVNQDGTVTGLTTKNVAMGNSIAEDPAIVSLIAPYQAKTLAYTGTVLGQSAGEYKGDKQLTEATEIMELINKVQASAAGTQLSIAAPLSLSAYIPKGNITIKDIMGVYVYENFLYGVKMNGAQLKKWMEYSVRYYKQVSSTTDPIVKDPTLNIADYNLDQLYGASYDVDLTKPVGSRIVNLKYKDNPIKDTDIFTVAINNYRYNGGGGFMAAAGLSSTDPSIVTYDSAKALGDDGQVRSLMMKYIQDNGTITPATTNNWKLYTSSVSTTTSSAIAINDLAATAGDGKVTLNFSVPTGATSIAVQQSIDKVNYVMATTSSAITATSTSAIVTGLTNGQSYNFRLVVTDGEHAGISNVASATPTAATIPNPPAPEVTGAPKADNISVTNNISGTKDTVLVTGLTSGDIVRVYDAVTGGNLLGTAQVQSAETSAMITIAQLGTTAGNVYVSVTSLGKTESVRTQKAYIAEVQKPANNEDNSSKRDKDDKDSSGNGNAGTNKNTETGNNKQSGTETINAEKVRTVENGVKKDTVKLDEIKVQETITKAIANSKDSATILIADVKDNKADQVEVQLSKNSTDKLAQNNLGLKIDSEKVKVELPTETLKSLTKDLKLDIKEVTEASKVDTTKGMVVKLASGAEVVGNPVEVETNYTGRTKLTIPLKSENLPKTKEELNKLLDSLSVYIEHSDGEKVTQKGEIVYDEKGNPVGISIWVDKFSTFTVISIPNTSKTDAKGNEAVTASGTPEIKFVGLGHSPLVEGDKEDFIISSGFNGNVQYRIYLNLNGAWKEVTNGYSSAVNGKETFIVTPDYKFEKGQYQGKVYVKKAGAKGSKEENGIDFDNYYTYNINCVDRDDANRIYTSGALNINKDTFKVGEKVIITGIDGISGIQGPYLYRLHIYDVANDKWINNIVPYSEKLEWTPNATGTYVLDIHVITPNSVLWDKVQKDPTLIYGGYEGWRLKTITVK